MTIKAQVNPAPLDYNAAVVAYRKNAESRREARAWLTEKLREKAQADHDHKKARSLKFAQHRAAGKAVEESKIHADADAADYALRRDLADAEAKGASARLDELEAERASLRQLIEYAREES